MTRVIHPIVIIGAGPAGIATAVEALKRGYQSDEIVLIEKSGEVAHMISTKYPDEKPVLANYKERMVECLGDLCIADMTKQEFMDYMKKIVEEKQLKVHFHQQVKKITKLRNGQLATETHNDVFISDAVFVAIGNMAAPRVLGINVDAGVTARIFYDLQNLHLNLKKVLVVGGGDSAGEYAKILYERGHDVSLSYRGAVFNRMLPANKEATEQLIAEKKMKFLAASSIDRIEDKNAQAFVHFKEPLYEPEAFDAIVTALGTERPTQYLEAIGINASVEGKDLYGEAEIAGLFLVGDLASGRSGGSINFAFNSGVSAMAKACSLYLDCSRDE